ncbi:mRNA-capping enzyme [Plasmodium coatneyi]|uniref:mRNA (guanine-N(7))-methyltransferase n=1 Tax=Plasmodium coatneyi TaxID=208452 RepID=A0A1B1DTC9_9APIC|nr:mRNA-capping enzyme [Plasmodium coatneyi]ANQ05857.1 mRNA-capping enzyme [Plasmodium coatneyi]
MKNENLSEDPKNVPAENQHGDTFTSKANNVSEVSDTGMQKEGEKDTSIRGEKGNPKKRGTEENGEDSFSPSSPPHVKRKKESEEISQQRGEKHMKRLNENEKRRGGVPDEGESNSRKNKNGEKKIIIDKNNLFHEINMLLKKKLKISDAIKIDLFYKDNCTQIKPYAIFDEYKYVNIENKINLEIVNFLRRSLQSDRKDFLSIHSSVVELRGSFNDELINLPIVNQIILQKISNNNYKYKFNIDTDVLNYIYVDLFKIHKSKYKFKILEKKYELEEWYYYDTRKDRRKGGGTPQLIGEATAAEGGDVPKNEGADQKREEDKNDHQTRHERASQQSDQEENSTSSESNESDALINLYNEEKKKEEMHLLNGKTRKKKKKRKKRKKKIVDKDKVYMEKLKKLVEEDSDHEDNPTSSDHNSAESDDSSNDRNQILYRRKIIYSRDGDGTVISAFKEVENDTVCVYYPNSSYNQCLNLSSFEPLLGGGAASAVDSTEMPSTDGVHRRKYDIYEHKNGQSSVGVIGGNHAGEAPNLDALDEENIKIKKRYVRDISIYNFCCDEKYKGCSLFLHVAKNKKLKNVKIDYNIDYSDFSNNLDIIKMYEVKGEGSSNAKGGENKRKDVGKLFELEKDWKVNVDIYVDIERVVREFRKREEGSDILQIGGVMADGDQGDDRRDKFGNRQGPSNKLDYVIYNFYKNFECLINLMNKLKNNSTKFDYFYPKMIGDVNEEIRKHYDKKKVILLKKSNIKYIRIFNNEVKRIMILFFVPYGSKILDLACGHGQDMLKYNTVKNKVYVGLDISKKEIELAKERLSQNDVKGLCNLDNFLFLQGDILNNKFFRKWKNKNITFDIISINLAMHYVVYNEKSSKKFFKIIENFLESEGLLLATTISTITLTDFLMKRSVTEVVNDSITLTLENDLFTIRFDQENLLKIFKNKMCLEEFVEFVNSNSTVSQVKYDYFHKLIKNALENTLGIKYYFYLYDTIDANEFVIPQKYLKDKLQELNMVELFNNSAIMFLHYITNNLETYDKYQNINYFNLINKTIDKYIFDDIKMRLNKIHGYNRDSQIYFDICSLYHVYVYKKNFDASILGVV